MARLKVLEPMIYKILEEKPASRSDNFILYIEVLKNYVDVDISLKNIFINHKILGIPSLEAITRCRRKIQENHPELKNIDADAIRGREQLDYIKYARGKS